VTTALPTQVTYGTFKGKLIDAINTGAGEVSSAVTGTVTASPAVNSVNIPAALVVMLPRPVTVTLDANGAFTMQLVATDDPALSVLNWAYQISFQLNNGDALAPFLVQIPGGTSVDLSTANPVSTGGGVAITQGLPGPAGPTAVFDVDAVPYLNATAPAPAGPGVQPTSKRFVTEASSLLASKAALPAVTDKVVFVSPRGADTNNGLTLKSALATLSAAITALGGPGLIQCGQGTIAFGAPISVAGTSAVTIRGVAGITAGATAATVLSYTGTGTASAINAQNSMGFTLADVMVLYTSASFTGRLVDLRNVTGSDTGYASVRDCYFGGSGVSTADSLIDLDHANTCEIRRCHFANTANGIRGKATATSYSNGNVIDNCSFNTSTIAHIHNPGDGWVIKGCTWEALTSGAAGAVISDSGVTANGLTIMGGWCGDVIAGAGGAQFVIGGGGISILGTFIGGNTGSTGVKYSTSPSTGITIAAFFNGCATGIDHVGGYNVQNSDYSRSSFFNVASPIPSGAEAQFENMLNYPVVRYRNDGSHPYGGVAFRLENQKGGYQAYDIGIDPDGGTAGVFKINDIVRNKFPFQITKTGSVLLNDTVLATTATDGFTYIPTCAGIPTGVPTAQLGTAPVVYDTTDNRLYVYNGGWKSAAFA